MNYRSTRKKEGDAMAAAIQEYPDFVSSCGYGDVQGICGAN